VRITNQILNRRVLEGLQQNLSGLEEAQSRAATGLRVRRASDDPAGYVGILSTDRRLAALDQYRRGISSAKARLDAEEGVLEQVSDLLTRARELGISQAGGTANATTRSITRAEVEQIVAQVISLGNTRHGEAYLFGGDFAADKPFAADGTTSATRPPAGTRSIEIGAGQTGSANHDALQIFADTNVISSIQQLSAALANDSADEIAVALTSLHNAFDDVQGVLGETGARSRQLEMATANLETLDTSLRTLRSDLSEVDMERAISDLISRQTSYEAALMASSRIISQTLADYLR
jgi:flagellar hook-associated protein 3 FlgL